MLKVKTKKQKAYMEGAIPEVKEVKVEEVKGIHNERSTWTIQEWDKHFKEMNGGRYQ